VINAESGHANGDTDSPTYGDVSTGRSGDTETVRVDYSLAQLQERYDKPVVVETEDSFLE
jgi:peptide methionine sulfoxide reductase MsrA